MVRKRLLAGLVGAVALVGVTSEAFAFVNAVNDFYTVSGSTLKIKISSLLSNDTFAKRALGIKFLRAFKTPGSDGIKKITFNRKNGLVIVKFKKNFIGTTTFKYAVAAVGDRPPGHDRDTANVFLTISPS